MATESIAQRSDTTLPQVLVVDDSATVRTQIGNILRKAGFAVIEAADGAQGYRIATSTPGLDLILSDVNMPNMNGVEMVELLTLAKCPAPVLMLTTEAQPDLVRRAKRAGAKGWMVKPFDPAMLVAAAKKLTE